MKVLGCHVLRRAALAVFIALLPVAAFADGMVVPLRGYAIPEIPDQQALIHYADGVETLVIETSFVGQGTNFAWVVPLPSVPQIKPVSAGLFPTLQTIFQPKVVLSVTPYWLYLPAAVLVLLAIYSLIRYSPFLVLLLLLLFMLNMLLNPRFSRAGIGGTKAGRIQVLNRQTVGLFDTTTIRSADPRAMVQWLNDNGFDPSTNAAPAIADYVRDGWVFVAARLNREVGETAGQATHPLAFAFNTVRPVYPLRLTATATPSCKVDLYIFGPRRAEVPGFAVKRCEAPNYGLREKMYWRETDGLRIRHRELASLVSGAPVATRLRTPDPVSCAGGLVENR